VYIVSVHSFDDSMNMNFRQASLHSLRGLRLRLSLHKQRVRKELDAYSSPTYHKYDVGLESCSKKWGNRPIF
jgi:hypothetical protein